MRINDITVSRMHCVINIEAGELFVRDRQSKYGIMALFHKNRIKLLEKKVFSLQISNTIYNFKYLLPFYIEICSCFL